jgi:hypothetical protein
MLHWFAARKRKLRVDIGFASRTTPRRNQLFLPHAPIGFQAD